MNAGNLTPVCLALREKLPDAVTIVVAADDDRHTQGNPGLAKAYAACDATGAEIIRPEFPCGDCDCTDFNDAAVCMKQGKGPSAPAPDAKPDSDSAVSTIDGPVPLTTVLPPVKPLVEAMLPGSIVGFVTDTA